MFARYIEWFEAGGGLESWDEARYARARSLSELAGDQRRFRDRIRRDIWDARRKLQLDPDLELPF